MLRITGRWWVNFPSRKRLVAVSRSQYRSPAPYLIPVFLLLVCVPLSFISGSAYRQQRQIRTQGIITNGVAFYREYKSAGKASGAYYFRYEFEYEGQRYKAEAKAEEGWARALTKPTPILVQFLPGEPRLSRPVDVALDESPNTWLAFVGISLGALAFLATRLYLDYRASCAGRGKFPPNIQDILSDNLRCP